MPAPDETICIYYSGPDRLGRYSFALLWHDKSAPQYSKETGREHICIGHGPGTRGQHFFSNPKGYKGSIAARGHRWTEIDKRGSQP